VAVTAIAFERERSTEARRVRLGATGGILADHLACAPLVSLAHVRVPAPVVDLRDAHPVNRVGLVGTPILIGHGAHETHAAVRIVLARRRFRPARAGHRGARRAAITAPTDRGSDARASRAAVTIEITLVAPWRRLAGLPRDAQRGLRAIPSVHTPDSVVDRANSSR